MEQQNAIASSDQQIRIRDDKKEGLMDRTQSSQKSVGRETTISEVKHGDTQGCDTNSTFSNNGT
ncbi:hypothetical protein LOAG_16703 [Loa loa]|uniref:Uncharacterized protein n=1 Tax=Loa loa TaxID=7209 RepID=A0A1S0UKS6_LOALO|nr:hypothetical protein LOAG_16703 [Loa loa]EJD76310.1 hypothetical protein LOAG_16703 [Loa loa]